MVTEVELNDVEIKVTMYQEKTVDDPKLGKPIQHIKFNFNVRSGEEYHKITTLLYKQTFDVKVPERNIAFRGTIESYSTSITNLYKENEVGVFTLELKEI